VTTPRLNLQPEAVGKATAANDLLPKHRILPFYGFPGNLDMGILDEYDMDRLLEELMNGVVETTALRR